jgi:F-type H+-transporting ATPase subunit gamma
MQSLDLIKRRIKTVQTTAKITNAMKLVATAKIKKQMAEFKVVSEFCKVFYDIIEEVTKGLMIEEIFTKPTTNKTLYVLVSSSLGLCGAFNQNVCKMLLEKLQPSDQIVIVGKKGFGYLRSKGFEKNVTDVIEISDTDTDYLEAMPISEKIVHSFITGEVARVELIYTKFVNSILFEPAAIQILPLSQTLFMDNKQGVKKIYTTLTADKKEIQFEPDRIQIIKNVIPVFVLTMVYAAIAESRVCENGARRNAMETASDNAKELIEDLTLQFNRARQEGITQEINEIVAGAGGGE